MLETVHSLGYMHEAPGSLGVEMTKVVHFTLSFAVSVSLPFSWSAAGPSRLNQRHCCCTVEILSSCQGSLGWCSMVSHECSLLPPRLQCQSVSHLQLLSDNKRWSTSTTAAAFVEQSGTQDQSSEICLVS